MGQTQLTRLFLWWSKDFSQLPILWWVVRASLVQGEERFPFNFFASRSALFLSTLNFRGGKEQHGAAQDWQRHLGTLGKVNCAGGNKLYNRLCRLLCNIHLYNSLPQHSADAKRFSPVELVCTTKWFQLSAALDTTHNFLLHLYWAGRGRSPAFRKCSEWYLLNYIVDLQTNDFHDQGTGV